MKKLILQISPLVLLLVLQSCSDEYCCNIPGIDAVAESCSDGVSNNPDECWMNGGTWNEGIEAVAENNECYSDQEECEAACHNLETNEGGQCQEGKE